MLPVSLPYGNRPCSLALPDDSAVVWPPAAPPAKPIEALLEEALDRPIGSRRLEDLAAPGSRVLVIVSDDTRDDPRKALCRAVLARLPERCRVTLAIANGTHGPCGIDRLDLGPEIRARAEAVVDHDAHGERDLVEIGATRRGTPVVVNRCVLEADLIVATGRIKPHYFAGYGAGAKAIFPGLGGNREIRLNHELKTEPGARAGEVDDNPCRLDIEEAVGLVPTPAFLVNAVLDERGGGQAAVAGDLRAAFRAGAERCRPLHAVSAPRSRLVVVSDELPVSGSLYQASKLVAAAAPLALPGGTVLVVAQCPLGTGPVTTVNRGIYEIGLRPRLPAEHRVVLVSDLSRERVEPTYCAWAASAQEVIDGANAVPTVLPRAGSLVVRPVLE